ncbi:PilT protein domain protein [Nitrosococcus halophilus Nc 4]|uniref:Ribonuclease VapC n=1 Tax=Nitrosococcus halophilus (strain Nc4) TaxID=472759 RepID=D5C0B4_NITHN|nr:PIN domain nuclease [Nitrosococcus halophilus]ADE14440.1 PilT protein domain protein [Nitrosococcus halophilus Nc 4]
MTLVDTSVWIDFFRGHDLPHVQRLEEIIGQGEDLALCGVILTEILQGIRDDQTFSRTQTRLEPLLLLPMTQSVFIQAAIIYRGLRAKGMTIRKPVDCMIAATALEHGAWLLHNDRDFEAIARHYPLRSSNLRH